MSMRSAVDSELLNDARAAALTGMEIAAIARHDLQRTAIHFAHTSANDVEHISFHTLNRANQLAHALRAAGLSAGDNIAWLCTNCAEFIVSYFASHRRNHRCGLQLNLVYWPLSADEICLSHCRYRR